MARSTYVNRAGQIGVYARDRKNHETAFFKRLMPYEHPVCWMEVVLSRLSLGLIEHEAARIDGLVARAVRVLFERGRR
jgi:hypothetical protein